jgi:hypothetical protein
MLILGIGGIMIVPIYMAFGTRRERHAPENHALGRYSDLQNSHADPIG